MPREFSRADRVADALQKELAELVRDELRDPRVAMANITAAEVSRDLAVAKVFVNFVSQPEQDAAEAAVAVLNGAAGYLRTQLAHRIRMRHVPKLQFIYDTSGIRGQKLSALIDLAISQDKQHHTDSESE